MSQLPCIAMPPGLASEQIEATEGTGLNQSSSQPAWLKPLYYRLSAYLVVAFIDDPVWLAFWFC